MKRIFLLPVLALILLVSGCTNWNYIDTGVLDPDMHKGSTIYEYLSVNTKHYTLIKAIADKGGVKDILDGKDAKYPSLMFIAPTDLTVAAALVHAGRCKDYVTGADGKPVDFDYLKAIKENVTVEECRAIILNYLFTDLYYRDTFPEGRRGQSFDQRKDGIDLTSINGNKMWFFCLKSAYGNFKDIHINTIHGIEHGTFADFYLPSTNITVKNGVVHTNVDGFLGIVRGVFKVENI